MGPVSGALLDDLVQQLEAIIERAVRAGLEDTVYLCRMARLDLLMRRHGIRDSELKALGHSLRQKSAPDGVVIKRRNVRRRLAARR
jgi:hypothetical protein